MPLLHRNESSLRDDVAPRFEEKAKANLPLSLGSLELEKRLWEKAPLRILTLSAEKDMASVRYSIKLFA